MVSTINGTDYQPTGVRAAINLYHVNMDKLTIFHGGDSAYILVKDYPTDLAFLPTGGNAPTPQDASEHAFRMAFELKPNVVVAIHGSTAQNTEFQKKVKEKMPEINAIIPEPYLPVKI